MPFFNRSNNEDFILAVQSAGVSRGRNGFRKDKSGEKLAESEEDLLEHRTDGTNYLIIALQNRGLLVLPRQVVQFDYWSNLKVSTLKSGRRNIRIKEEDNKLVLYNRSNQATIDVKEYLHPCEVSN